MSVFLIRAAPFDGNPLNSALMIDLARYRIEQQA